MGWEGWISPFAFRIPHLISLCADMLKIILTILFVYIAFGILLYLMQGRVIYRPDRVFPEDFELKALGLRFWPGEEVYRGLGSIHEQAGEAGTVVVFHGNAGSARHREHYMEVLEPLGFRVVLAEYPGYGGREGKKNEKSFAADAETTVRLAHETYGDPLYVVGESLGCGVAATLAKMNSVPFRGMVLITPWESLFSLAQARYWFLPARWLIRDRYDSSRNLAGYQGRVAVALAEYDEVIPNQHGLKLYESLLCEKKLWIWQGENHNSWPGSIDISWWKEVMGFLGGER